MHCFIRNKPFHPLFDGWKVCFSYTFFSHACPLSINGTKQVGDFLPSAGVCGLTLGVSNELDVADMAMTETRSRSRTSSGSRNVTRRKRNVC